MKEESYRYNEPYLRDHLVKGEQVLLGVTYAALALDNLIGQDDEELTLERLLFHDRVVLQAGEEASLKIESEEKSFEALATKTGDAQAVKVAEGKFRKKGFLPGNIFKIITQLQDNAETTISKTALYKHEEDSEIIQGESLQVVEKVYIREHESLALLNLTDKHQDGHDYRYVHPSLLNGSIFAGFSVVGELVDTYIPVMIKKLVLSGKVEKECFSYGRLIKSNREILELDCMICNREGEVLVTMEGFICKRMTEENDRHAMAELSELSLLQELPSKLPSAQVTTEKFLREQIQKIYKGNANTLPSTRNFMDLGLDSSQLISLVKQMEENLKVDLYPTLFFEYQNIKELSVYLSDTYSEKFQQVLNANEKKTPSEQSAKTVNKITVYQPQRLTEYEVKPLSFGQTAEPFSQHSEKLKDPIAVIGMHGVFPAAKNVNEFWAHLYNKTNLIKEIPLDHFDYKPWFDVNVNAEDKMYCKWGSFINNVDQFEAEFFNISPREAELMDPQLRYLLQVLYGTAEDAGRINSIRDSNTGLYVGVCFHDYVQEMVANNIKVDPHEGTGNAATMLANRPSFYFNWTGPSMAIDTACSSSLVALHTAVRALQNGECDQAFVAGANLLLSSHHYRYFSSIGALSRTGRCHSFDSRADGYVPGESVAAMLLKPLRQAEADNDHIYGLIRGNAVSHGGYTPSITAPSVDGEVNVLLKAWEDASISPDTLGYVETHGTGTPLGDPVELNALKKAYKKVVKASLEDRSIAIGSAKSHIGHTEGAAGIVGVIKAILSINKKTIPAMPDFKALNPYIELDGSPFYINAKPEEWKIKDNKPRRAGISSFGFGGAYAHVIVEEYIEQPQAINNQTYTNDPVVIPLSAKDKDKLRMVAQNLLEYLTNDQDDTNFVENRGLHDIAYTLQIGRETMEERLVLLVNSTDELVHKLEHYLEEKPDYNSINNKDNRKEGNTESSKSTQPELLAEQWLSGIDIDWQSLYTGAKPRKLSLPTYPFVGERYWIPKVKVKSQSLQVTDKKRYPLLNGKPMDTPYLFESVLIGNEPFLADHMIDGVKILPGVVYLELAREAGERCMQQNITQITNIQWLSPIWVEESSVKINTRLKPSGEKLSFEVYSEHREDKKLHSSGELSCQPIDKLSGYDIKALRSKFKESVSIDDFYTQVHDVGLILGASLKSIQSIYFNENEILSNITLFGKTDLILSPGLLDGAVQTCIAGSRRNNPGLALPFCAGEVNIYAGLTDSLWCYVRKSVNNSVGAKVDNYDIDMIDDNGNIVLTIRDFAALSMVSHRPDDQKYTLQHNNIDNKQLDNFLYIPRWNRLKVPEKYVLSTPGKHLLVTGNTQIEQSTVIKDFLVQKGCKVEVTKDLDTLPLGMTDVYLLHGLLRVDGQLSLSSIVREMELSIFHVIQQLLHSDYKDKPLNISVLSVNTQQVLPSDHVQPAGGGIPGLAGSLSKEKPLWNIRIIDVDHSAITTATLKKLFSLPYNRKDVITVYRKGHFYKQSLCPIEIPGVKQTNFRENGTYVILGGAGGLGKVTSAHLIKKYNAQLIWLGRRPLEESIKKSLDEMTTLGKRPLYISCDATDKADLTTAYQQIKTNFQAIHGLFHSAIVLQDKLLKNMDEEDFKASFDPKSLACHYLVDTFKNEPLDFICFYSSIQSQLNAAGQANYSAGCSYKDSYAHSLKHLLNIPVYTINWGYWGEAGIVSDTAYRKRMLQLGIESISPQEGMHILETVLSHDISQAAAIKFTDNTYFKIPLFEKDKIVKKPNEITTLVPPSPDIPKYKNDEALKQTLEQVCMSGLLQVLLALGLEEKAAEQQTITTLRANLKIVEGYDRLFHEFVRVLCKKDILRKKEQRLELTKEAKIALKDFDLVRDLKILANTYPDYEPHIQLLEQCLISLKSILQGELEATEIIFPEGDLSFVSSLYKGNYQADYFNDLLATCVTESVSEQVKNLHPGEKIRIMEIGAGTGGTSEILFSKLAPYKEYLEYIYTDISKSFLLYAETHYKPIAPYLETILFNIETWPLEQGIPLGKCDIVIGANVVHATKNINNSLHNIKGVLKENGLLILNEITHTELFTTLIFGLLEGWWLYEDEEIRIEGSPGLSNENWQQVLEETGYEQIKLYPQVKGLSQQIVMCQSDGMTVWPLNKGNRQGIVMPGLSDKIKPEAIQNEAIDIDRLKGRLVEIASETIKLPAEKFTSEKPFLDYGFDSILGQTLIMNINQSLSVSLQPTDIFNYPNIKALATYIKETYADAIKALLAEENNTPLLQNIAAMDSHEPEIMTSKNNKTEIGFSSSIQVQTDDIAIIGMSGQFGAARNLEEFWELLKEGKNLIEEVPPERWDVEEHYNADKDVPNKTYSKWGSFLRDIDMFDPIFFQISGREAELMDPQQRFFLQHCWKAIEDAALHPKSLSNSKCGVFVGAGNSDYLISLANTEASTFMGNSNSILASRISYYLNLKGPAIAIDTACSSSLVAIDMGCVNLRSGAIDLALCGGVTIMHTPFFYKSTSSAGMLSPDGQCNTFDSRANGFVPGEGVGVLAMKRLTDAERDNDHIYGVIKGSMVNQDGATNGITAPSVNSQRDLEIAVYEKFGINPETISYVEAHGTGTSLGDPIEFEALKASFESYTNKKQYCSIGSVKTNIGHTLMAAGVAGVIKVLLSMKHKQLPSTINYKEANPLINFSDSPFRVQDKLEDWKVESGLPRRATVSGFGFSGTNAHIVIEAHEQKKSSSCQFNSPAIITLSARNKERLQEQAQNLKAYLKANNEEQLHNIAYTLQSGREAMEERLALIVKDTHDLVEQLSRFLEKKIEEPFLTGNTRADNPDFILKGEAGQAYIQKALVSKELESLAQLWVKGVEVDWKLLYTEELPDRLSLPTYPFARERYWKSDKMNLAITNENNKLHPLLHANISDLKEHKYESTYTGNEWFLMDHQIKGEKIMPGAAYLELAREAGERSAKQKITRLSDITWLSPISMNGNSKNVNILLFEDSKDINYEVYTQKEEEEYIHCQGKLSTAQQEKRQKIDILSIRNKLTQAKEKEACYQVFEKKGLSYGKTFQGIEFLYYNNQEALSRITLPKKDGFMLQPGMLDSAIQTCISLGFHDEQQNHALPYSVKELNIYDELPESLWCYVRKISHNKNNEGFMCFDIDLLSDKGEVLLDFKDLVALSPLGEDKFEVEEIGTQFYADAWEAADAATSTTEVPQLIILAGASASLASQLKESLNTEVLTVDASKAEDFFMSVYEKVQDKLEEKEAVNIIVAYENAYYKDYSFISGLLKTVRLEYPIFNGKVLGVERLSLNYIETLAKILKDEQSSSSEPEVRYVNGKREVRVFKPITPVNHEKIISIKKGGVYLITGGAGELGRIFATYISETPDTKIILTGRSKSNNKQNDLKNIRGVEYYTCDISDKEELSTLIMRIKSTYKRLDGIIHSAGVTRDGLIAKKTKKEINEVLLPKITGTLQLDEATKDEDLDFVVYFSSLVGVLGNIGQAVYASANAFMDQYAQYRNELKEKGYRKGHTLSINWPLWEISNLRIDAGSKKHYESHWGLHPMPVKEGIRSFEHLLKYTENQGVILYGDVKRMKVIFSGANPMTKEKIPRSGKSSGIQNEQLRKASTDYIIKLLAEELKLPTSQLVLEAPFEKYGIDSIMITHLTNRLDKVFGRLPRTLFFEYQTLGELIDYFLETHGPRLQELTEMGSKKVKAHGNSILSRESIVATNSQRQVASNGLFPTVNTRQDTVEPIAIIGLSGRYPGASNINEFWENLKAGKDSITEIPKERWDIDTFYDKEIGKEGKMYSKWGGFIEDVDKFDPVFFNISPREAEKMDPQERLFLQTAWEVLEDAGYTREALQRITSGADLGGCVGVYAGVMYEEYQLFAAEETLKGNPLALFSSPSSIANRVSYFFNFHGPSMAVDTMCSSSLTAIHLACESIHSGQCELAIAGGVNVSVHPNKYLMLSQGRFISARGRCESFGEGGEGYIPGEGVGAVLLKPLSNAMADGDHIYGLIRGSSLNHGGKTNGYTVPNPNAQAAVIKKAIEKADLKAEDFSYIEAHGTGTSLGDPIEIAGLTKAYESDKKQYCSIGSVKSNIGHGESAAGISGLTKVLLQMKYKQLVPSLHSKTLNPNIDFEKTPFKVQQKLETWETEDDKPRIAGISSFGAGGSNAHLVVEEYNQRETNTYQNEESAIILLSAKNEDRLKEHAQSLKTFIEKNIKLNLHDIAFTLQTGREAMNERLALVVKDHNEAIDLLADYQEGRIDNLLTGNAKKNGSDFILSGPAGKDYLSSAIKHKQFDALAQLWVNGVVIDWSLIYNDQTPGKIALPTYPFERKRYWFDKATARLQTDSLSQDLSDDNRSVITASSVALRPVDSTNNITNFLQNPEQVKKIYLSDPAIFPQKQNSTPMDIPTSFSFLKEGSYTPVSTKALDSKEISNQLAILLKESLYLEVEIDQDVKFIDYGMDSVVAVEYIKQINKLFSTNLSATDLYDHPNIKHLAAFVHEQLPTTAHEQDETQEKNRVVLKEEKTFQPNDNSIVLPGTESKEYSYGYVVNGVQEVSSTILQKVVFPDPIAEEIQIKVKASSINFPDLMCIKGLYPTMPAYPFIPGFEVSGTIEKIGERVKDFAIGDEVVALTSSQLGGHASHVNVPVRTVWHKPRSLSFEEACSLPIIFLTTYYAMQQADLKKGERILIQTAAGGCGLMALQLSHLIGAVSTGTSSKEFKLDFLNEIGVEYLGNYTHQNFEQKMLNITQNRGFDMVLNMLSGDMIQKGLNLLGSGGRYIELAVHALKASNSLDLSKLTDNQIIKSIDLRKKLLAENSKLNLESLFGVMTSLLDSKALVPVVSRIYPLAKIGEALSFVATGAHIGKVVISHTASEMADRTEKVKKALKQQKERSKDVHFKGFAFTDTPHEQLKVSIPSNYNVKVENTDIAIIGMSGVFPGSANVDELWEHLKKGSDLVTEIPDNRWDMNAYFDKDSQAKGKSYSKWMGVLDDIDKFDPSFFNISPREAKLMDPQQRLFLEQSWKAIEDAGYMPQSLSSIKCGVFVGVSTGDYNMGQNQLISDLDFYNLMGASSSILSSRISYFLNLKGSSIAIDTACSSSLVALTQACDSLLNNNNDLALAGGVCVLNTPRMHIMTSKAGMLSPDGRCYTFDQKANGFVPAEGAGVLLLKRLTDAQRDNDHIYGVVKGWSTNQDGSTNGITAPSKNSQVSLQREVYDKFSINPETISYVEAHGTGTNLGDPIEVKALTESFKSYTKETNYCGLGSVKSNMGHALTAAGVSGIIKVLLSLKYKQLPPTINYDKTNEHIDLNNSPFYINTKLKEWETHDSQPRRAAVSSFGYSGTNVHVVLEEYQKNGQKCYQSNAPAIILLSAKNKESLKKQAQNLKNYVDKNREINIYDVAYTLQVGRAAMEERLAFIANTNDELIEQLSNYQEDIKNNFLTGNIKNDKSEFIFEGDAGKAYIQTAITKKQSKAIAQLWVKGVSIDWNMLYSDHKPEKISLPTYPFAKETYWYNDNIESHSTNYVPESSLNAKSESSDNPVKLSSSQLFHSPLIQNETLKEKRILKPLTDISYDQSNKGEGHVSDIENKKPIKNPSLLLEEINLQIKSELAEVLFTELENIDEHKSFTEMGLDSILGVELMKKLESLYQIELRVAKLYSYPNIKELSKYIADLLQDNTTTSLKAKNLIEERQELVLTSESTNKDKPHSQLVFNGRPIKAGENKRILSFQFNSMNLVCFKDHVVYDQYLLPTDAYLEMAFVYAQVHTSYKTLSLEKINLVCPMIGYQDEDTHIQLTAIHESDQVKMKVESKTERAKNYSMNFRGILKEKQAQRLINKSHKKIVNEAEYTISADQLYQNSGPTYIGPFYRSIQSIYVVDKSVVSKLVLPEQAKADQEAYLLHPSIVDGLLVTALSYANRLSSGASHVFLPTQIDQLTIYDRIENESYYGHVVLTEEGPDHIGFNLELIDEEDQVILSINGLRMRKLGPKDISKSMEGLSQVIPKDQSVTAIQAVDVSKELTKTENVFNQDIAIIGVAGVFPGANSAKELWSKALSGSLHQKNTNGQTWLGIEDPTADLSLSQVGLAQEEFDLMSRQYQLTFAVLSQCMMDYGLSKDDFYDSRTGVFIAATTVEIPGVSAHAIDSSYTAENHAPHMLPAKISFQLNLTGPSEMVNTSCVSSYAALHRAVQSIRCGECDQAIVGGVNVITEIMSDYGGFTDLTALLSKNGQMKSFCDEADGIVRSEGVGVLVIKSLDQAKRDKNNICALIKGLSFLNAGKNLSWGAPNHKGIEATIRKSIEQAGIDADTIDYIETHGIANHIADAIELGAINDIYRKLSRKPDKKWHIGSIKPCVGHSELASGMASLIVAIKALENKMIPGIAGLEEVNKELDPNHSMILKAGVEPWKNGSYPRRAALNSYAVGSVNAHIILEEYRREEQNVQDHDQEAVKTHVDARPGKETSAGLSADDQDIVSSVVYEVFETELAKIDMLKSPIDYGFDSVKMIQFVRSINEKLDLNIKMGQILGAENFAAYFKILEHALLQKKKVENSNHNYKFPVEIKEAYPLSEGQKGLWFIQQLEPSNTAYNVPLALMLNENANKESLQQALKLVLEEYPVLRTSFVLDKDTGEPTQVIKTVEESLFFDYYIFDNQYNIKKEFWQLLRKPFDLKKDSLLRLYVRSDQASQKTWLLFVIHHIVFDGTSSALLVPSFFEKYQKIAKGETVMIKQPDLAYFDFVDWEKEYLNSKEGADSLAYWENKLSGTLPVLTLPYDHLPSYKTNSKEVGAKSITLQGANFESLKALSKQLNINLSILLLSAFKMLIHRLSGEKDIIVLTPTAGRPDKKYEQSVGYYINIMAIRSELSSEKSFREVAKAIKQELVSGIDHAAYPYPKLMSELCAQKNNVIQSFLQVSYLYQNIFDQLLDKQTEFEMVENLPGLYQETEEVYALEVYDLREKLEISLKYDKTLFKATTIQKHLEYFRNLLIGIIETPDNKLKDYKLLSEAEKNKILKLSEGVTISYPQDKTVVDLFREQAKKSPDAIAIVYNKNKLTYKEIDKLSDKLAHQLISLNKKFTGHPSLQETGHRNSPVNTQPATDSYNASIAVTMQEESPEQTGKEKRIAIMLPRSERMIVTILAIMKSGSAYVPVDIEYPQARKDYMLKDSTPICVISEEGQDKDIPPSIPILLLSQDLKKVTLKLNNKEEQVRFKDISRAKPKAIIEPNDLAYVIYTSGSTGQPKGVMIEHKNVYELIAWSLREFKVEPVETVYATTSLCFDLSVFEIFYALSSGKTLRVLKSGLSIADYIASDKNILINTVPSVIDTLLNQGIDFSNVVSLNMAGEPIPLRIIKKLDCKRISVINLYGPSEDTTYSSIYRIKGNEKYIPIGTPVTNTQIYILSEDNTLQPIGIPGELCISGAGLARGYLNNEALTKDKFIAHPFKTAERLYKTGDNACWQPDGNIAFMGRKDDQLKIRGYRIEPGEISARLNKHKSIKDAVVIGKEVNKNKELVAYVIAQDKEASLDIETLRSYLMDNLPSYMIPTNWVKLESFPLTANGKLDKKALLDLTDSVVSKNKYVPAGNEIEKAFTKTWKNVLGLKKVGIHDNFFEIGGHSLLAIKLMSEIQREANFTLSIRDLYNYPTINSLCNYLENRVNIDEGLTIKLNDIEHNHPILFFIPPIIGSSIIFKPLAQLLENQLNCYGLQYKGFDKDEKFDTSIKTMVETFMHEIFNVQKGGKFILVGYSMGGTISFELAKLLEKSGYEVILVILDRPVDNKIIEKIDEESVEKEIDTYLKALSINDEKQVKKLILHYNKVLRKHKLKGKIKGEILALEAEDNPTSTKMWEWEKYTTGSFKHRYILGSHFEILNEVYLPGLGDKIQQFLGCNR